MNIASCVFALILLSACRPANVPNRTSTVIDTLEEAVVRAPVSLVQTRLGATTYYVQHPDNMLMYEARGKEGQLGYGFEMNGDDNHRKPSFFIEVRHGNPVVGSGDNSQVVDSIKSVVLGELLKWQVHKTQTGYLYAEAGLKGLRFDASAYSRSGLDFMVGFVATLSSR